MTELEERKQKLQELASKVADQKENEPTAEVTGSNEDAPKSPVKSVKKRELDHDDDQSNQKKEMNKVK